MRTLKLHLVCIQSFLISGHRLIRLEIQKAQEESRVKGNLAVVFLLLLTAKTDPCMGSRKVSTSADVIMAMVAFSSNEHPWATDDSVDASSMQLSVAGQDGLWSTIEQILKEKIKPLFTKQRNPNITAEGRKNFHPVPLARFDGSTLDDSTRPWKNTDIYASSVLSWIVSQYKVRIALVATQHGTNDFYSPLIRRIWKHTFHSWSLPYSH